MAYLSCTTYAPTISVPINLYLPQWGCTSPDFNRELQDCVPPFVQTASDISNFIATMTVNLQLTTFATAATTISAQFAPLSAVGINYTCNSFYTGINRNVLDTCPCIPLDPINVLGGCGPYVNYSVSVMLNSPLVAQAVLSNKDLMNLITFSCPDCFTKATEFACLAAFPLCLPYPGQAYIPVNQSVCNNSLVTCRAIQYADPELIGLIGSISQALGLSFAAPNVTSILDTCAVLPTNGFIPPNYQPLDECACDSMPASSQCNGIINHQVAFFLANLNQTIQAKLEGTILQFDTPFNYTGCPNCKKAVDFDLCNAAYPACTDEKIAVRGCASDCLNNVAFCTDTTVPAICTLLSAAYSTDSATCNPIPFSLSKCSSTSSHHSGTSSLVPSFFVFMLVALLAKILF